MRDSTTTSRADMRGTALRSRPTLGIGGTDRQLLVIYHAPPGTSSAEKMALLGCRST
jgi:hypothetical protein